MLPILWERSYRARRFEQADMEEFATDLGLDLAQFTADMNGPCRKIVRDDQQHLARVGVRGTPVFFINGRYLSGARPIDHFRVIIDEELALAKKRIRAGTKLRRYYNTWVLKKGKKSL